MRALLLGSLSAVGLAAGLLVGGIATTTLAGCCFCTNPELIEYGLADGDYEVSEWSTRSDGATATVAIEQGQQVVFEVTDGAGVEWAVTYDVVDESWRPD